MTRFETLPEDAHAKLKTDPRHTNGNELLPATVATTMRGHDRPIWTASQMQAELDTGHGKETVRNKLNTLEEIGICASMRANGGRIYWWDDERSDWPLPPDVAVEGREGPTLAEVLDPWYAKVGLIGLLSPAVAGVPIVAGVLAVGGALSLPIEGSELLSMGLIAIVLSYVLMVYAGLLIFVEWATDERVSVTGFTD
ncbi:hypothetical protein ACFR97_00700 [Haloplanus litoreus]|uniref:Uncharacterized protein n=1 Tax=Haloplanus litoreus TaxID=767515 RepID=A0ABD5ZV74_9EURY